MTYELKINKNALKFILKQTQNNQDRLFKAIYELKENPEFQRSVEKMRGEEGTYRKRVGGFRIIYEVHNDQLIVQVLKAGNRGDIYL